MPSLFGGVIVRCTALLSQACSRSARVSGAILICHHKVNVSCGVMRARVVYVGTRRCGMFCTALMIRRKWNSWSPVELRPKKIISHLRTRQEYSNRSATCSNEFRNVPIFVPDISNLLKSVYCVALTSQAVNMLLNSERFMASST